ncbi:hypothetical protein KSP39_PZI011074 [Platanthera zijinensis]|uniref:Protein FAR1-RELATED SEQUENCE n=1 Tax=Platanthera zijinensis TaxID=2320716 RepID=A0AAP0G5F0_9ASPA
MRTIYNEKNKLYKKELQGGTPIQFLYKCIRDAKYISYNHVNHATNNLDSLFFAHPTSIQLSNMFPDVFVMDCTYKTNRYRLPLLSIVGLTSTNMTFTSLPNVIVVDREVGLMNAIKVTFPQTRILLCQVHISRNILAHCKKFFKHGKECEEFLQEWQTLVNSPTISAYNIHLNVMLAKYSEKYPNVVNYVMTTWIEPYREYFVSAWIDNLLHFGNSTTNRVESGHSHLKRFLEVSVCNLTSIWKTFDQMLNLQHTEIKHSFGQSSIQVNTGFRGPLYTDLIGFVSIAALDIIKKEEEMVKSGHPTSTECLHKVRYTMGLPCSHELVLYMNQSAAFPLWMVHKHWRQLTLKATTFCATQVKEENDSLNVIEVVLDGLLKQYNSIPDAQRNEMKRKLQEIMEPTITQTKEPLVPFRLKGRPRGSYKKNMADYKSTKRELSLFEHVLKKEQNIPSKAKKLIPRRCVNTNRFLECIRKEMPSYISTHITDAVNVVGDGHCGYRVVSNALDMGDNWFQVRKDLAEEMKSHEIQYNNLFGNVRRAELLLSLDCTSVPAPLDKWMTMPDMGLVIASCYNVAVVHYSKFQSFTFLPLHTAPPTSRKTIFIGFVNNNHYIHLLMRDGCPLPPVISMWTRYHDPVADEWDFNYISSDRVLHDKKQDEEVINLADP